MGQLIIGKVNKVVAILKFRLRHHSLINLTDGL